MESRNYKDSIHKDKAYVKNLFLTIMNLLNQKFAETKDLMSSGFGINYQTFLEYSLEVYFHTDDVIFRRLFVKLVIFEFANSLRNQLESSPQAGQEFVMNESLLKLLKCCLCLLKFNMLLVKKHPDFYVKEDLKDFIYLLFETSSQAKIKDIFCNFDDSTFEDSDFEFGTDDSDDENNNREFAGKIYLYMFYYKVKCVYISFHSNKINDMCVVNVQFVILIKSLYAY